MSILVVTTSRDITESVIELLDSRLGKLETLELQIPHIKQKHEKVNNNFISTVCHVYYVDVGVKIVVCGIHKHRQITITTLGRILRSIRDVEKTIKISRIVWDLEFAQQGKKIFRVVKNPAPVYGYEPIESLLSQFIRNKGRMTKPRSRKPPCAFKKECFTCIVCKGAKSTASFDPCGCVVACDMCAFEIWNVNAELLGEPVCPACERVLCRPPHKLRFLNVDK